jgi:succinoglycan biosynthesis protein ExoM
VNSQSCEASHIVVPEISICICTLRRPAELELLLRSLQRLDSATPSREVIIVDNDSERSAEPVVQQAIAQGLPILYDVEPIQSIALARTRTVRHARGEWIAFIDDDEEADPRWLLELWTFAQATNVDGVFGFVERRFEPTVSDWIRTAYPSQERITGASLYWWQTATNNALVRRSSILSLEELFNPVYSLTGGEDCDLFYRMAECGCAYAGLSSAIVYETVTVERAKIRYLLRWWLGAGAMAAHISLSKIPVWQLKSWLCKKLLLFLGYGLAGALYSLSSRSRGMRYFAKATLEGGALFGKITGVLIQRYPSIRPMANSLSRAE